MPQYKIAKKQNEKIWHQLCHGISVIISVFNCFSTFSLYFITIFQHLQQNYDARSEKKRSHRYVVLHPHLTVVQIILYTLYKPSSRFV